MISINNVIIVEPYLGKRKIEATVNKGLATVKQRGTVVGLKVLVDARISDTQIIKKDSVVFLNEKYLYENQNVLTPMECDSIEGSFIILSVGYIVMVKEA